MKAIIRTILAVFILTVSCAFAGVNGSYRVTGSEKDNGKNYTFTGTVKVESYRNGTYSLKFNDGDKASHKFKFTKPLKETTASQTVTGKNAIGITTATFYTKQGKSRVQFSYKSLDGSVRGQGTGSK